MIKFLKENIIFVVSSILLTGLISVVSGTEKIPSFGQSVDQPSPTVITNPAEPTAMPSPTPRPRLRIEEEDDD